MNVLTLTRLSPEPVGLFCTSYERFLYTDPVQLWVTLVHPREWIGYVKVLFSRNPMLSVTSSHYYANIIRTNSTFWHLRPLTRRYSANRLFQIVFFQWLSYQTYQRDWHVVKPVHLIQCFPSFFYRDFLNLM